MPEKVRKMLKRWQQMREEALSKGRITASNCCGKSDAIIAAVKLRVVAGDEVGSQNPEGTYWGRNVQTSEGYDADVSLNL